MNRRAPGRTWLKAAAYHGRAPALQSLAGTGIEENLAPDARRHERPTDKGDLSRALPIPHELDFLELVYAPRAESHSALYRHPVKGFTPESCEALTVLPDGRVA
mgnify:CR=1 FL=1